MESIDNSSLSVDDVCTADIPAMSLARDVTFLVITTLVVMHSSYLSFTIKKGLLDLLNNVMFWVFLLYIVAILVTIIRYPVILNCWCPPEYFSILYNWAASLIIWVSSIMPMKILMKSKVETKRTRKGLGDNLKAVLACVVLFVVLLVVSLVVEFGLEVDLGTHLLVWRIFTITSITVELACLIMALRSFEGTTLHAKFKWYLIATLWMRGGIAVSLVFKYMDAFATPALKVIHTSFIITGLLMYNKNLIKNSVAKVVSAATSTIKSSGSSNGGSKESAAGSSTSG